MFSFMPSEEVQLRNEIIVLVNTRLKMDYSFRVSMDRDLHSYHYRGENFIDFFKRFCYDIHDAAVQQKPNQAIDSVASLTKLLYLLDKGAELIYKKKEYFLTGWARGSIKPRSEQQFFLDLGFYDLISSYKDACEILARKRNALAAYLFQVSPPEVKV